VACAVALRKGRLPQPRGVVGPGRGVVERGGGLLVVRDRLARPGEPPGDAAPAPAPAGDGDPRLAGPRLTLGAVARDVEDELRARHPLSPAAARVLRRLVACRTPALGGALELCRACGHWHAVYRSCGDRHCATCGALPQERWVRAQHARTLDVAHLHVVVTLPAALRGLCLQSPRDLYGLLLAAAGQAVREVAAEALGPDVRLGWTAVLHTWSRFLRHHPHAHLIVTAGGLDPAGRWIDGPADRALLPGDRLAERFAAAYLDGLERRRARGELPLLGRLEHLRDPSVWRGLMDEQRARRWHVYAKRTLAGAEAAFGYLARYVARAGFSDGRLLAYDADARTAEVTTKYGEVHALAGVELVRRALLHALPRRFRRIRHAGLYGPRAGARRERARTALAAAGGGAVVPDGATAPLEVEGGAGPATADASSAPPTAAALFLELTGVDLSRCPRCSAHLDSVPLGRHRDAAAVARRLLGRAARPPERSSARPRAPP